LNNQTEKADHQGKTPDENSALYDYAHVDSIARIALYDDLKSAPRVTEINPAPTADYIENLASSIYEQAKLSGGTIPYTVIREVSENFIHAQFAEVTVSILDGGNTIRFADQGPGIFQKDKAQLPGFSSAVESMKQYIRGVGSGLPIVKEYLDFSHGTITIEDNLGTGSVVTISLQPSESAVQELFDAVAEGPARQPQAQGAQAVQPYQENLYQQQAYQPQAQGYTVPAQPIQPMQPIQHMAPMSAMPGTVYPVQQAQPYGTTGYPMQAPAYGYPTAAMPSMPQAGYPQHSVTPLVPPLSQRERDFLPIFLNEGALGVTDLVRITGVPQSSTYVTLTKLEQAGLIEKTAGQKRILTDLGYQVAISL
jgi:hypothetical protein